MTSFPACRLRRGRSAPWIRDMLAEHRLHPSDLIWPLFIADGKSLEEPIASLPGVSRWSVDRLAAKAREARDLGVGKRRQSEQRLLHPVDALVDFRRRLDRDAGVSHRHQTLDEVRTPAEDLVREEVDAVAARQRVGFRTVALREDRAQPLLDVDAGVAACAISTFGDEPDDGSAATPPPTGSPARTVPGRSGSRTMARACSTWPAPVRRSHSSAPDVSVPSSRVSEMVSTAMPSG